MGNLQNKQYAQNLPAEGCRVIQILSPVLESKLQPFTDYIVQPSPQQLKKCTQQASLTVFSSVDYSIRNEIIPISNNHFGARIKVTKITDCALKVTKIFPHSPCQKLGILVDQYIVGLLQADFDSLSSFAQALHLLIAKSKDIVTLGVCNREGITRLISTPVVLINEWKIKNQGMLGCQLAQGWMHRFKIKPKRLQSVKKEPVIEEKIPQVELKNQQIQANISTFQKEEEHLDSQESNEIQRKLGTQKIGECLEINFKGLLKNEYLEDASSICRCKIYDKSCERCWLQKEGSYLFFNKKTNRIISIPDNLMLKLTE